MDYFLFDFSGVQFHYTMSHYFGVYVYNKNDELVMTYYVHPNLWDAYRVTVDGEVKLLCSNDAMG